MMWRFFPGFGYGYGYYPGSLLINLLLFLAVIAVAALIFRRFGIFFPMGGCGHHISHTNHRSSAEEILRERYARGEITREDYLKALEDLKK
ncbi:SHOCT domain-containing protein [Carboxydothermus hydrogenoformans]|uniref:SHOCT domain-containing protein n=1 Tax=Carboxydothermus hydrogenoformans (strain ATCC BAA-161 / DSM 6008 / Z-2901) TaxID=246194 RepID=Q3A9G0_CARHZ|nr:SHOCT domain-containing protein [Carboxydothermus hydrogenoformans]ABB15750.1 conserved hypothetical protein [Carboxydothermus hydrogenoformans Z-2901]